MWRRHRHRRRRLQRRRHLRSSNSSLRLRRCRFRGILRRTWFRLRRPSTATSAFPKWRRIRFMSSRNSETEISARSVQFNKSSFSINSSAYSTYIDFSWLINSNSWNSTKPQKNKFHVVFGEILDASLWSWGHCWFRDAHAHFRPETRHSAAYPQQQVRRK